MALVRTAAEAEINAAAKMRDFGFVDATALPGGPDGGIDVYSQRAYAQVKWRGGIADKGDLENLYGARGLDHKRALVYFSGADYTESATEYAASVGIALFVFDRTGEVTPVDRRARDLMDSRIETRRAAPAKTADQNPSAALAMAQSVWVRVRELWMRHWPLIGAVWFTVSLVAAPFSDWPVGVRVVVTILSVVLAPVFWTICLRNRQVLTS